VPTVIGMTISPFHHMKCQRKIFLLLLLLILSIGAGIAGFAWGGLGNAPLSQQNKKPENVSVPHQGPKIATPSQAEALSIVRATMEDFSQALLKNDFTDFYGNVSTLWRKQATTEKIATAFAGFLPFAREVQRSVRSGPILNEEPLIDESGTLLLQGFYRIEATKMLFKLQYVYEDSSWKLFGMNVEVK